MIQKAAATDEAERPPCIGPKGFEPLAKGLLEFFEGGERAVAEHVVDLVPLLPDRIEFGAGGRPRQEAHVGGPQRVPLTPMEAGPVLDEDVQGRRIAACATPQSGPICPEQAARCS